MQPFICIFLASNTLSAQNPADTPSLHQTRQLKEAVIEGSTGKVDEGEITSEKESPEVVMVELRPEQLWNLHIAKRIVKNKNGVKSYTYTINPDKFTKKRVDLSSLNLSLGSWNIKDESLDRYIRICEEDGGEQASQIFELDWSLINPEWFDGDRKLYLGDSPIVVEKPIGGASSNIKKTEVTLSTFSDDDNLGTKTINFYDPVIIEKSNNGYLLQAYNTGIVTFGIIVR